MPPVQAGQTRVSVVRIVDHCLAFRSEVVAANAAQSRLATLRADPAVVAADIPARVVPAAAATGTKPVKQWALDDLHADQVRKLWPAGADVRVAIIDTGIDDSNPDLAGQVVEKAPWSHVYHGDDDFHGTHVAGIVSAKDDGHGVLGLTPQAKLLDVQYWDEHGQHGDTGEDIRWAVDHGADVINMSFSGSDLSDTEEAALLYAEQAGVVAVSIAGNCGLRLEYKVEGCKRRNELRYPGGYDATVLSVAGYNKDHGRGWTSTSSANSSVDLAAPGDGIVSTCLMPDQPVCDASGTSMAAPYVSATAALLLARHPDATPAAIREAIVRSTRPAPGHPAGVHSDAFGTGLLDPVAAAAYLDQHPGGTIPRPSASSGTVAPDAIVAGYVGADHKIELTTASGGKIPVAGVQSGQPAARIAFSRDGAWFSAADGTNLAIVNVQSRRQETVTCACRGVAFNDKGQLLTADGDVIATYEPATAGRLHGVRVRNPGAGLPSVMPLTVEGSGGGVTVVGAQFASAGYGAFGVRPDGTMFLIGQGPDPGVDRIVMSDDGRWVAWSIQAACLRRSQMGIADLTRPGTAAYVTGPTADGEALQIHFDGNNVVAGWAPLQHTSSGCGEPPWPPAQWQLARPAMGTGTAYEPATAQWSRAGDPRIVLQRWPSGEGLYLQPTKTIHQYEMAFGPAPGGGGLLQLDSQVIDAVARPDGSNQTPTQAPTPSAPTSSAPTSSAPAQPSGSPATVDAAIARYEKFLHALGASDVATICEIAGPGMKKAEAQGIGPCPTAYRIVFQMISPAQRAALKTATVDHARVTAQTPSKVFIPAAAVKASVTFTSSDLGDYTLEYLHGQWYITG